MMRNTLIVLAALVSCCWAGGVPLRKGLWATPTLRSGRVVGGHNASPGDARYQVSLRVQNSHFCGGSILTERWILTAAHCVIGADSHEFNATIATQRLDEGGDTYTLDKVIWHDFSWTVGTNDIAVLKTSTDMVFGDYYGPVVLGYEEHVAAGTLATLTGFGSLVSGGPQSTHLQILSKVIITNDDCELFFEGDNFFDIFETQICAYTPDGEGACNGDSGGPLTADDKQVGIVSWGAPPCGQDFPDVYTRVSSFYDWIAYTISYE